MAVAAVTFYSPAGNGKVKTNDSLGTWIVNAGGMALNAVTFVEGTGSIADKVSATTRTAYNITAGDLTGEPWNFSSGGADENEHIVIWLYMYEGWDTLANGGFGIIAADDLATDSFGTWLLGPQSGYIGGWYPYIVSPNKQFNTVTAGSATWTTSGNPAQLSGVDGFGAHWKVVSTISGNSDNVFMDAIVVGLGYQVTNGDAGSPECTFADFVTYEETNRFGFMRPINGLPFFRGKVIIGFTSGAGNTEFIDTGFTCIWEKVTLSDGTSSAVDNSLYEISAKKGSGTTDITLSQGVLKALSPHTLAVDWSAATSATLTGVNLDRGGAVTLGSTVTWTNSVFTNSGQVAIATAVFTGNTISGYTGAADTAAIVWNNSANPDSNLENCTFTKTAATAHHAIQFGTSTTPNAVTLRGMTFTNFNSANGQNDSVLLLDDQGSDKAWVISAIGCNGTVSYKKVRSGDTVDIVVDPVTVTVTTLDVAGDAVGIANVFLKAASGGAGILPVSATINTITHVTTTATATHAAVHNMLTGDKVFIQGASPAQYNGVFTITVTSTTVYTYVMDSDPGGNATGSPVGTFVFLKGTTNAVTGVLSMSRVITANQNVTGWARKSSASPFYKTAPLSGTVSSSTGLSSNAVMILDE